MNKTKIEWCDGTWNPVTGCLHNCPYCYARKIANRFGTNTNIEFNPKTTVDLITAASNPYPYGFHPTFHRYRLNELKNKKAQNIFVCSMADLFGEWVPDEWISEVIEACKEAPQHNYLFLTKNPARYEDVIAPTQNMWFGTTVTNNSDMTNRGYELYEYKQGRYRKIFLSIEPLQEKFSEKNLDNLKYVDWVIVGAETGNRKNKIIPNPGWLGDIAGACRLAGVPIFMKDSLVPIIGERNMFREFPEGLQKDEEVEYWQSKSFGC
jgi:protein gp37